MPWKHVLLPRSEEDELMRKFEFIGYPRTILVDRNGHISAFDARSTRLYEAVKKVVTGKVK